MSSITRGRKRSNSFNLEERPLENPLNPEEQSLASLVRDINLQNAREAYERAEAARLETVDEELERSRSRSGPRSRSTSPTSDRDQTPTPTRRRARSQSPASEHDFRSASPFPAFDPLLGHDETCTPRRPLPPPPEPEDASFRASTRRGSTVSRGRLQLVNPAERARRRSALTQSGDFSGNTYRGTDLTGGGAQPLSADQSGNLQARQDFNTVRAPSASSRHTRSSIANLLEGSTSSADIEDLVTRPVTPTQESYLRSVRSLHAANTQVPITRTLVPSRSHLDLPSLLSTPILPRGQLPLPPIQPLNASFLGPRTGEPSQSLPKSKLKLKLKPKAFTMSYQNFLDSPQGGPTPNSRQAPPSPSQNINPNGMNGVMGIGGAGYPTPAGHQADLNMIMGMVEALSNQLQANQALTASIVEKTGLVRELAQRQNLSNDEIIALAGKALDEPYRNLDKEISELRKKYDKCLYDKKEWQKLCTYMANIIGNVVDLAHEFKEKHEADTLAWHKNYRNQLKEEREENLQLRCQIQDMRAHASKAYNHLTDLRRAITDDEERHELIIQNHYYRQMARHWKRQALPLLPDDDPEFSDDDDLIDPEEKKRLAEERKNKEAEKEQDQ
ncbi:hypothetical protein BP5796_04399 [Coleophoma crateriformis]|uniref:Uncharacterized protein n=1 Tax=Coleophoma crateriformis TaxID=565419 RepID=A0A3D8SAV9_9HELO|nr:hypothetical protein BP5796_04399 [Coleophoma crateriformis]